MPETDRDLLNEIRERHDTATLEFDDIQQEARKDRLCVAGKPWQALDPEGARQRVAKKRPMIAADELGQYLNQIVNSIRANPRGIKYTPTGNGANDKGAEFYQNHTREIEYRSHASIAYSGAFENAVSHGYGWIRITSKFESDRSLNQDLWIEPIVNPDAVIPDPSAVWPDSRDMSFLFYVEARKRNEFKREFGKSATITSFTTEHARLAPRWLRQDEVLIAEYWAKRTRPRKLEMLLLPAPPEQPGAPQGRPPALPLSVGLFVDEIEKMRAAGQLPAEGIQVVGSRMVDFEYVKQYLTNGIEMLGEPKAWAGKHIPFVSCYGKVLYVDEGAGLRRNILSMTRLVRDPYMLYCYIRTCEAEAIGGIPRSQWVGYKGQFFKPAEWKRANSEPVTFLESMPFSEENPGQLLPLPQRQPWDPPLQNLEISAEAARRAIQAAMGVTPLPTPLQRDNQKSGKALQQLDQSAQRGSFHFVDHYELMIERAGIVLEDLIDKVIDTARDVSIREPNDTAKIVRVNDPRDPKSITTKGDYRCTVSTAPSSDSQRDAASDFVDSIITNIPMVAQVAGQHAAAHVLAISVKMKQLGPMGDEIAKTIDPEGYQQGTDGQEPPTPKEQAMQAKLQQAGQMLQQAQKIIETEQIKAQQAKELKQMELASREKIAADDRASKERLEVGNLVLENKIKAMDREVKLAVAEISTKSKEIDLFLKERDRVGAHLEADAGRAHEATQAELDRQHAVTLADQAHQNARALADQTAAHGLRSQVAGAALEPEPPAVEAGEAAPDREAPTA